MTPQEIVFMLGDFALLSAIPALALFVIYYYFGSPWKTLLVGRSLMYFAASLLSIIIIVSLSVWLGTDYFLREWVRFFGFAAVSFTTWRLFITLRHIQKKGPVAIEEIGLAEPQMTEGKSKETSLFHKLNLAKARSTKKNPIPQEKTPEDETSIQ